MPVFYNVKNVGNGVELTPIAEQSSGGFQTQLCYFNTPFATGTTICVTSVPNDGTYYPVVASISLGGDAVAQVIFGDTMGFITVVAQIISGTAGASPYANVLFVPMNMIETLPDAPI